MPTIFADTNNGTIFNSNQSSHANARDATAGNSINTTSTNVTAFSYLVGPGRGGGTIYRIDRIFLYFDTSTITSTPASATFSIQRTSTSPIGNFRIIKSTLLVVARIQLQALFIWRKGNQAYSHNGNGYAESNYKKLD